MDSEAWVKSHLVNGSWWRKRTQCIKQWSRVVSNEQKLSWKLHGSNFFFQRQNMSNCQCNRKTLKDFKMQKSHKNVTGQMSGKICFVAGSKPHGIYRCSRLQRCQMVEQPMLSATLQKKKIWCSWRAGGSFWKDLVNPRASGFPVALLYRHPWLRSGRAVGRVTDLNKGSSAQVVGLKKLCLILILCHCRQEKCSLLCVLSFAVNCFVLLQY